MTTSNLIFSAGGASPVKTQRWMELIGASASGTVLYGGITLNSSNQLCIGSNSNVGNGGTTDARFFKINIATGTKIIGKQIYESNPTFGDESITGICTDSSNNTYVLVYKTYATPYASLVKYDSSMNVLNIYSLEYGTSTYPVSINLDSAGNIYILLNVYSSTWKMILCKLSSTFVHQWSKLLTDGTLEVTVENKYCQCLSTIDTSGNIYYTGTRRVTPNTNQSIYTIKYDNTGTLLWKKTLQIGTTVCIGKGIDIDSAGNVYICGSTASDTNGIVAKYNSTGTLLWQQVLTSHRFTSITVEKSTGNIYVGGVNVIVKYNSSGTLIWQRSISNLTAIIGMYNDTVTSSLYVLAAATGAQGLAIFNLPNDGSLTGTYGSFIYAVSAYTNSAGTGTDDIPTTMVDSSVTTTIRSITSLTTVSDNFDPTVYNMN